MIYKIKATVPVSKVFMREFAVRSDMNLFRFNRYILGELCFSTDQMVIYKAYDSKGNCTAQYGLFDLGDGSLDKITFADVVGRGQMNIELIYDLRSKRKIDLVIEGEIPEEKRLSYPCIIAEKGHNPGQFADKYEDYLYENPVRGAKAVLEDVDDDDDEEDEEEEEDQIYDGGLEDDTLD
ncbi:MAG: hypothetical protein IKX71_07565 [Bacteroidales bacterium]|nr:hypothetical protein [Bacteroidales bacterium]